LIQQIYPSFVLKTTFVDIPSRNLDKPSRNSVGSFRLVVRSLQKGYKSVCHKIWVVHHIRFY